MEGLWGPKSHTTCVKCPYRAKTKDQYGEPKKGLIQRDIAEFKTRTKYHMDTQLRVRNTIYITNL